MKEILSLAVVIFFLAILPAFGAGINLQATWISKDYGLII